MGVDVKSKPDHVVFARRMALRIIVIAFGRNDLEPAKRAALVDRLLLLLIVMLARDFDRLVLVRPFPLLFFFFALSTFASRD